MTNKDLLECHFTNNRTDKKRMCTCVVPFNVHCIVRAGPGTSAVWGHSYVRQILPPSEHCGSSPHRWRCLQLSRKAHVLVDSLQSVCDRIVTPKNSGTHAEVKGNYS